MLTVDTWLHADTITALHEAASIIDIVLSPVLITYTVRFCESKTSATGAIPTATIGAT